MKDLSERDPIEVKNLDRYGFPALPWSRPRELLAHGTPRPEITFFLGTSRPDGRPHAAGIGALWLDGDLYFRSGPKRDDSGCDQPDHASPCGDRVSGDVVPRCGPTSPASGRARSSRWSRTRARKQRSWLSGSKRPGSVTGLGPGARSTSARAPAARARSLLRLPPRTQMRAVRQAPRSAPARRARASPRRSGGHS